MFVSDTPLNQSKKDIGQNVWRTVRYVDTAPSIAYWKPIPAIGKSVEPDLGTDSFSDFRAEKSFRSLFADEIWQGRAAEQMNPRCVIQFYCTVLQIFGFYLWKLRGKSQGGGDGSRSRSENAGRERQITLCLHLSEFNGALRETAAK